MRAVAKCCNNPVCKLELMHIAVIHGVQQHMSSRVDLGWERHTGLHGWACTQLAVRLQRD
jgi:hypothetical protein